MCFPQGVKQTYFDWQGHTIKDVFYEGFFSTKATDPVIQECCGDMWIDYERHRFLLWPLFRIQPRVLDELFVPQGTKFYSLGQKGKVFELPPSTRMWRDDNRAENDSDFDDDWGDPDMTEVRFAPALSTAPTLSPPSDWGNGRPPSPSFGSLPAHEPVPQHGISSVLAVNLDPADPYGNQEFGSPIYLVESAEFHGQLIKRGDSLVWTRRAILWELYELGFHAEFLALDHDVRQSAGLDARPDRELQFKTMMKIASIDIDPARKRLWDLPAGPLREAWIADVRQFMSVWPRFDECGTSENQVWTFYLQTFFDYRVRIPILPCPALD